LVSKVLFYSVERKKQGVGCSLNFRHIFQDELIQRLQSLSIDRRGTLRAWTRFLSFGELK